MPVSSLEDVPENMTTLTIPAATYAVFTTRKDQLLKSFARLGTIFGNGQEKTNVLLQQTLSLYDERALDPTNVQLDIYIALFNDKKKIPNGIFFLSLIATVQIQHNCLQ